MVMAQAARLNLRLQKEIKLLLTDPPHGATFPSLSPQSDSDSSSSSSSPALTSIDAQIQGPEGTVYEKGVFKLKIQIPERYPFQPPIVMFITPIYHPNIDNGGRICLDILNLPPKGAWQPSLNISTVLTSLGLLLSEPNPDDGLMQEASREHKYNRQAFDQKARSMTDKYACAGSLEMARGGTPSDLNKELNENMECMISMKAVCEESINCKRMHGVSNKLSLGASETDKKGANHDLDLPTKKIKGLLKESKLTLTEQNSQTYKNLQCRKKKLQLGCKHVENSDSLIEGKEDQDSLHLQTDTVLNNSSKCLSLSQNGFKSQQDHYGISRVSIMDNENSIQVTEKDDDKKLPEEICAHVDEGRKGFISIRHKKLGLTGRRLPWEKLVSLECNDKELETNRSDEKLVEITENQEISDSVVVLDSEDEKVVSAAAARPKRSLARRPLPGKRKSYLRL